MYIDINIYSEKVYVSACAFALYTKPEMKDDVMVVAKILNTLKSRGQLSQFQVE